MWARVAVHTLRHCCESGDVRMWSYAFSEAVITSVLERICHVGKVLDSAWTVWMGTLVMFLSTCVLRLYSGSEGRRFDEGLVKCWGMCCWKKTMSAGATLRLEC
jgi:hypothetical protein